MTGPQDQHDRRRYSFFEIAIAYLMVQAFLLTIMLALPWPIVGVESWGGHSFESVTPKPVWAMFWAQFVVGLLIPLRGKAFLIGQLIVFTLAYLLLGEVQGSSRYGRSVLSSTVYIVYWFQFFGSILALISWRYRETKLLTWYPLIAYFAIQLIGIWGVAEIRRSLGPDVGNWILSAFVLQGIGLLFTPNRIRLIYAGEILLAVLLALAPKWIPAGWNGLTDPVFTVLWVVFFLQCGALSWFLFQRRKASDGVVTSQRVRSSMSHPGSHEFNAPVVSISNRNLNLPSGDQLFDAGSGSIER